MLKDTLTCTANMVEMRDDSDVLCCVLCERGKATEVIQSRGLKGEGRQGFILNSLQTPPIYSPFSTT